MNLFHMCYPTALRDDAMLALHANLYVFIGSHFFSPLGHRSQAAGENRAKSSCSHARPKSVRVSGYTASQFRFRHQTVRKSNVYGVSKILNLDHCVFRASRTRVRVRKFLINRHAPAN